MNAYGKRFVRIDLIERSRTGEVWRAWQCCP